MATGVAVVLTGAGVPFGVDLTFAAVAADRRKLQAQINGLRELVERGHRNRDGAALIQVEALRRSLEGVSEAHGLARDIGDRLDRVTGLLTTGREDWRGPTGVMKTRGSMCRYGDKGCRRKMRL